MLECIVGTTPEHVRMAQALRYQVYCEEKAWIDSSSCDGCLDRDDHDEQAVHFLALENGVPIGTSRLLLGERQTLPATRYLDLGAFGIDPSRIVEVSRLATRRSERSSDLRVFLCLCRLMWQWSMDHSMEAWLAIADVPLFRLLDRLKMPTLRVGEHVEYLGSVCVPVAFDVPGTGACLYGADGPPSPRSSPPAHQAR